MGSGRLPAPIRSHAEQLFGQSFADVRVMTNSSTLDGPGTPAATLGADIHLRSSELRMSSDEDRHYLGHELAHVVQNRSAGPGLQGIGSTFALESEANSAADRFVEGAPVSRLMARPRSALEPKYYLSDEHKKIGDEATASQVVTLSYQPPYTLTYGDIVAMVGDYFASFDEMKRLAQTTRGRNMLSFVRDVKVHNKMTRAQYLRIDKQAVEEAENGFTKLMADNQTHFLNATEDDINRSRGRKVRDSPASGPQNGAQAYRYYHEIALESAFFSGDTNQTLDLQAAMFDDAHGQEAGAGHFLTDAFSAGFYAAEGLMPEAVNRHSPFNWKADDGGSVKLSTMLATPQFQAGWASLALKIVEEARLALDTKSAMFDSLHQYTGETSTLTEAAIRLAADRFLNKLESEPMGSLLDILGPGQASLVLDKSVLEEVDPYGYDPDEFDGPIDDGGGL
nr:DUF4157 domain-containing protein [Enhygromyxa salina]